MSILSREFSTYRVAWFLGGISLAAIAAGAWLWWPWSGTSTHKAAAQGGDQRSGHASGTSRIVRVDHKQQEALGIETAEVRKVPSAPSWTPRDRLRPTSHGSLTSLPAPRG